ncbi:UNVERIFIED_CONTAM: hypothetical protein GTU68_060409 [Idotea baltica]|nr:hypothetical protein [Idotea baltica]
MHAPTLGSNPADAVTKTRTTLLTADPSLKFRVSELRLKSLFLALVSSGLSDIESRSISQNAFQFFLAERHRIQLLPGTINTLSVLSQKYQLAVLTNGNADVRRLGLAHYFQVILSAEMIGTGKPDPKTFHELLKKSGVKAAETLHIGDHLEDDIQGAISAGLHAIWLNADCKEKPSNLHQITSINSLDELPKLLIKLYGS